MNFRHYKSNDCKALSKLFFDTVHKVNAKDYSQTQLNVWATGTVDLVSWNETFLKNYTIIAELGNNIVGFGDIDPSGYINMLYIHKDFQNIGIATEILKILESQSLANKFTTYASITAKPFFEKYGYKVSKENFVERQNVVLKNFLMEKDNLSCPLEVF